MKFCSDFRKNCLSFIRVCCFSSGGFCPFMGDGPCYHCCHLGFTFGKAANTHNTVKLYTQIREYTRYTNTRMSWPVHKHISYQCPYRRCHLCTLLSFTTKAAKASFLSPFCNLNFCIVFSLLLLSPPTKFCKFLPCIPCPVYILVV